MAWEQVRNGLREAGDTLLSLFYPSHCAACLADTRAGQALCPNCAANAPTVSAPFCDCCSQPFSGVLDPPFLCPRCTRSRSHFHCAVARYRSQGVVRDFIHRFKYEGHYYLRYPLARWLAEAWNDPRLHAPPADLLVPVPLHPARRREREFNQAEVLARLLSRECGVALGLCLRRTRYTSTQTRLNRHRRMENLRGAFSLRQNWDVQGRHLILVDDVFTTGSTVEECARVLSQAGAGSIRAITVARA